MSADDVIAAWDQADPAATAASPSPCAHSATT
jgi:hypothetical protein